MPGPLGEVPKLWLLVWSVIFHPLLCLLKTVISLCSPDPKDSLPRRCLGCKTTRSVTSFWPTSPSVYSSPSLGGPLLFSWVLLWLTQLLSSKCSCVFLNLRSCSHPPGKNYVNHPCRFWRGGLSSIGIDDSFFYSCFLNLLWKKSLFFHGLRARNKKIFT